MSFARSAFLDALSDEGFSHSLLLRKHVEKVGGCAPPTFPDRDDVGVVRGYLNVRVADTS